MHDPLLEASRSELTYRATMLDGLQRAIEELSAIRTALEQVVGIIEHGQCSGVEQRPDCLLQKQEVAGATPSSASFLLDPETANPSSPSFSLAAYLQCADLFPAR